MVESSLLKAHLAIDENATCQKLNCLFTLMAFILLFCHYVVAIVIKMV